MNNDTLGLIFQPGPPVSDGPCIVMLDNHLCLEARCIAPGRVVGTYIDDQGRVEPVEVDLAKIVGHSICAATRVVRVLANARNGRDRRPALKRKETMSATNISLELVSENDHPEGFYYRATVETGTVGVCRLNVECRREDEDAAETSQGMDLSAAECRALAQMLLAGAAVLDAQLGDN